MKQDDLMQLLSNLEPIELRGVQLLKELRLQQPCAFFPAVGPEQMQAVVDATLELMVYARRCQQAAQALTTLQPMVLHSPEIVEYL